SHGGTGRGGQAPQLLERVLCGLRPAVKSNLDQDRPLAVDRELLARYIQRHLGAEPSFLISIVKSQIPKAKSQIKSEIRNPKTFAAGPSRIKATEGGEGHRGHRGAEREVLKPNPSRRSLGFGI